MRESRSPSQILFNFLPQQTADLRGRVWKVDQWLDPVQLIVDDASIRRRVLGAMDPWHRNGTDAGNFADLVSGADLDVVRLNNARGVHVERFPDIAVCRVCRRIPVGRPATCRCGASTWRQLHFVGFHNCGWLGAPWIPRCQAHDDVAINDPGSTQIRDLVLFCPVCQVELLRSLGAGRPCPGCRGTNPGVSYNVHRAASVYTPHTFTMVNPARPDQLRELTQAGGAARCLDWVLAGMAEERPTSAPQSREVFIQGLVAQGLPQAAAEAAAEAAAASGAVFSGQGDAGAALLAGARLDDARDDALDIAMAVYNGRLRARTLAEVEPASPLFEVFRDDYPRAMDDLLIEDVELIDRFPVLRGVFGYTRGGGPADANRLVMYRGARGARRIYGDSAETEAMLVRLNPNAVLAWLVARGLPVDASLSGESARLEILRLAEIPARGEQIAQQTVGSSLLTLVHSMSHRFIRQLSVYAGVDREAISEYLVPRHLGFFLYAVPRGDFVLGGLQAVFESNLQGFLRQVLRADSRCPLDPGCSRGAGSCLACLHLGEPSCTHFNRFLDRGFLFGPHGFWGR